MAVVSYSRSSKPASPHPNPNAHVSTPNHDAPVEHAHTVTSSDSISSRNSLHARVKRIEASLASDAAVRPQSGASLPRSSSLDSRTRGLALLPKSSVLRSLVDFYFVHVEPGIDVLPSQSSFLRQIQPLITRSQHVKAALGLSDTNMLATIKALPAKPESHPAIEKVDQSGATDETGITATPTTTTTTTTTVALSGASSIADDATRSSNVQNDHLWQEIDLIALLLVLLQGAFEHLTIKELQRYGLDVENQAELDRASQVYCDAALDLVRLDSRLETPTLTFLQVVVSMRHYYLHRGRHRTYATFNTMAIRLAIQLGLHRLGSLGQDLANTELLEQANTAPTLPAASSSTSTQHASNLWGLFLPSTQRRRWLDASYAKFAPHDLVLRELGRKVWNVLVCMDWFQASHYDGYYSVHPGSFTTAHPINLSQKHIESALMSGTLPRPFPQDHPTESSFLPILSSIAQCSLEMADAANKGRSSYADLCVIEAQLRTILDQLPRFYRLDGHCENLGEVQAFHRQVPRLTFQRLLINETIHHRILKIHRLYLLVGLQSEAFQPSAKACISSSLRLVELVDMADARSWPGLRYWHLKLHLADALSNLAVVLIHRAGQPETDETRHYRSCLNRGVQILRSGIMTAYLSASIQVIRALARAELSQRCRNNDHVSSRHPLVTAADDDDQAACNNREDLDQVSARIGLMADTHKEEDGDSSSITRALIADATTTRSSTTFVSGAIEASGGHTQPATTASALSSDEVSHYSSPVQIDLDNFVSRVMPGNTFGFWQPTSAADTSLAEHTMAGPAEIMAEDSGANWSNLTYPVDWTEVLAQITSSTAQRLSDPVGRQRPFH